MAADPGLLVGQLRASGRSTRCDRPAFPFCTAFGGTEAVCHSTSRPPSSGRRIADDHRPPGKR